MSSKNSLYNVLIADNQPIVIEGLRSLLGEFSEYHVVGNVSNGETLLKNLKEIRDINTLIIDINLPNTNIFLLMKELTSSYPDLKIIIFSNFHSPKIVQTMMEKGVHAYFSKFAELPELVEAIKEVHEGVQIISPSVYYRNRRENNPNSASNEILPKFSDLTKREIDIIMLLSKGMTNKEMAEALYLSVYTIETHRKRILKKLGLKSSAQLVHIATLQGVV